MTQPTEAHWQEAERQYRAFWPYPISVWREETIEAMAELVAKGAKSTPGYKASDTELAAAREIVNAKVGSPRHRLDDTTRGDLRFHCIASMLRSLGQATADPLSDGERKELAELRAFKARVMEAVK